MRGEIVSTFGAIVTAVVNSLARVYHLTILKEGGGVAGRKVVKGIAPMHMRSEVHIVVSTGLATCEGCNGAKDVHVDLAKRSDVHLGDAVWLFMPRSELGDATCFMMPELSDDVTSEGGIEAVFRRDVLYCGSRARRVRLSQKAHYQLEKERLTTLVEVRPGICSRYRMRCACDCKSVSGLLCEAATGLSSV